MPDLCETCRHWEFKSVMPSNPNSVRERKCAEGKRTSPFEITLRCSKHESYPQPVYQTRFERILGEDDSGVLVSDVK